MRTAACLSVRMHIIFKCADQVSEQKKYTKTLLIPELEEVNHRKTHLITKPKSQNYVLTNLNVDILFICSN